MWQISSKQHPGNTVRHLFEGFYAILENLEIHPTLELAMACWVCDGTRVASAADLKFIRSNIS
jgi:hypothetical protein